jgi:hypothetical protein
MNVFNKNQRETLQRNIFLRNAKEITSHFDLTPSPSPTRRGEKTPSPFGRGLG